MFTNRRSKGSFIIYIVKNNLTLFNSLLFIFCFLFLIYAVSNYNGMYYYGQSYCLADAYVWFLMPRAYGIFVMPFILLLFINFTKHDHFPNVLLRLATGGSWLRRKIIIGVFLSFIIAAIAMIVVTFVSSFQVSELINWDRKQSIYYAITNNINKDTQVSEVIILAFITIFIRNLFICFAAIVFKMKFNSDRLTFLTITIISVYEMIQKKYQLFYGFITLDYYLWEDSIVFLLYVSYSIVIVLVFAIIMQRAMKNGEWVYEG